MSQPRERLNLPYRRTYERYSTNDTISLITGDGKKKQVFLQDLSVSGAGISGEFAFVENEMVTVNINSPLFLEQPVTRRARVAWCQASGIKSWDAGLDFGMEKIAFKLSP